jgi:hypothetical protein
VQVLVIDIGGSHLKLAVAGRSERARFDSSPALTPTELVRRRQLPGRCNRSALDRGTRVVARRVVVSAPIMDPGCGPTGVARIPARVSFQEKWRQAITLIRRARAAGLQLTAVVADAEFGISQRSGGCCINGACRMRWASAII